MICKCLLLFTVKKCMHKCPYKVLLCSPSCHHPGADCSSDPSLPSVVEANAMTRILKPKKNDCRSLALLIVLYITYNHFSVSTDCINKQVNGPQKSHHKERSQESNFLNYPWTQGWTWDRTSRSLDNLLPECCCQQTIETIRRPLQTTQKLFSSCSELMELGKTHLTSKDW